MRLGNAAALYEAATKSTKLRVLADLLDLVDRTLVRLAEVHPEDAHENGEMFAPFCFATSDEMQAELRDWADQLDQGFPLYNVPRE